MGGGGRKWEGWGEVGGDRRRAEFLGSPSFPCLNPTCNNENFFVFPGDNPEWNEMVQKQTDKWKLMLKHYIIDRGNHPVLVVHFEDLKRDTFTEITRMLDFIQFPYSNHTLEQRLQDGYTQFRRRHRDHFEHYTEEQRELLNSAIRDIIRQLRMNSITDLIGLQQYLRL